MRSTEEIVALGNVRAGAKRTSAGARRTQVELSERQENVQRLWRDIFDTRVIIKPGKKTSKLVIEYADEDDLERITQLLKDIRKQ